LAFVSYQSVGNCPEVCLNFTSESLGNPTSWLWEFEGGSPAVSIDENPANICFATGGEHQVTLTVSNAGGTVTSTEM